MQSYRCSESLKAHSSLTQTHCFCHPLHTFRCCIQHNPTPKDVALLIQRHLKRQAEAPQPNAGRANVGDSLSGLLNGVWVKSGQTGTTDKEHVLSLAPLPLPVYCLKLAEGACETTYLSRKRDCSLHATQAPTSLPLPRTPGSRACTLWHAVYNTVGTGPVRPLGTWRRLVAYFGTPSAP